MMDKWIDYIGNLAQRLRASAQRGVPEKWIRFARPFAGAPIARAALVGVAVMFAVVLSATVAVPVFSWAMGQSGEIADQIVTFPDITMREQQYLPQRSTDEIQQDCLDIPPMLVRGYRLELLAVHGAEIQGRWAQYFDEREWYMPEYSIDDVRKRIDGEDRRRLLALGRCEHRHGI